MKNESIAYGIIGLFIGILITSFTASYAVNNRHEGMMTMMRMHTDNSHQDSGDHGSMSMMEMSEQLENKTGDDFDKAFIEMMIVHHDGAIEMAELIPDRAKHDELKKLGEAIIDAQTREINDMKKWQKDWGYSNDNRMRMMNGN